MGKHFILLFIFLLANNLVGISQSNVSDSLRLEEIKSSMRGNPDSALVLLKPFLKHANDSIVGTALNLMANAYYYKSDYDSAIFYYLQSAQIFEQRNDEINSVKNYNNLGVCYYFLSQFEKAYDFHHKSMEIRERLNDPKITSTYNNLGLVLQELDSYEDALHYFRKALKAKIELGQFSGLSTTLTNIGNVFLARSQYDSAIYYELINIQHMDSLPNERSLSLSYNNIGLSYLLNKEYDKAEPYLHSSLEVKKKINNRFGLVNIFVNLAKLHFMQGEYKLADNYLDSIRFYVDDFYRYRGVLDMYKYQYRIDSALGDYKGAQSHLYYLTMANDSIRKIENESLLLELEEKYQSDLKEQQIAQLEQENLIAALESERQKQLKWFLIIGTILLFIAIGLLYNRNRVKSRTNNLLDTKNKELQELNYTKDRLFSIISHDLKSPLSSFHTITRSLTDNWSNLEKAQLKEFIESLRDSSKEVHDMMDNLLRWALSQTGQLVYKPQIINPSHVVDEVKKQLTSPLQSSKIELIVKMEGIHQLEADNDFLKLILHNLVSNAIKFSNMESTIEVLAKETEKGKIISIKDFGVGIRSEDMGKLFGDTAAAHEIQNSANKGTGLGLTLCKELMEKMGGRIEVESEPNKGSTFILIFPKAA